MRCIYNIQILVIRLGGVCAGHIRKVCNIGEDVQCSRDSKSKRSSNLEGAHWIPDFIENVVRILPSVICEEDREHCSCVLRECQSGAYQKTIRGTNVMGTTRTTCERMTEIYVRVFNPCFTGEHNPT